ncbi:hypothetical protein BGZ99_007027 [Dissophora globulifera]|uniref:Uncharacterized protein n=1 Tax=Dissophora globulifera TaxID=979702 RepID=A0A9P6RD79_9FUNG|nr:hypothetical protein BGZ99_007027 [Dissophora globulifera]
MASRQRSSVQSRRHQLLSETPSLTAGAARSAQTPPASAPANVNVDDDTPCPTDALGAIQFLLDILRPQLVRQQKVFPRLCMVHQLYSIVKDNTAVDRTLAQLIQGNTVRKFYLGGTGSDEFAVMLTSDYVMQIQQAKEQYLQDLEQQRQQQASARTSASGSKRKADSILHSTAAAPAFKKVTLASSARLPVSRSITAAAVTHPGSTTVPSDATLESQGQQTAGDIFDRFKDLVTSGHFKEISIEHSNIQDAIGATDQDITSNTGNSGAGGHTSGGHSALNQLIHATNQEHAKSVKSEAGSSSSSARAPVVMAEATTISAALGRRERVSDDVAYRFAIRQGGLFVTHLLKGRLEILRMIRRQMFGDMLQSYDDYERTPIEANPEGRSQCKSEMSRPCIVAL